VDMGEKGVRDQKLEDRIQETGIRKQIHQKPTGCIPWDYEPIPNVILSVAKDIHGIPLWLAAIVHSHQDSSLRSALLLWASYFGIG